MLTQRLLQNLLIGFLAVLLVLGVWWAAVSGTRSGKSTVILKNAAALKQGAQYFFSDQNRYPTSVEFQDRNLMLNYFAAFPPQIIAGGPCVQTYNYTSASAKAFELDFCLPKASGGFLAGWNKIKSP
jgi:hypothetical protein